MKHKVVLAVLTVMVFHWLYQALGWVWNRLPIPIDGLTNVLAVFAIFMLVPASLVLARGIVRVIPEER